MDWWLAFITGLFALGATVAGLRLFYPLLKNSGWSDALLLTLAFAAAIAALARQLPVLNVFFAAGIAAGIGGVAHAVNDVTGFPFGRFEFTNAFGPRLFGVLPLAMPGLWAVAALSARGVARIVLRNSRNHPYHGYHVIGTAVVLMIVFQFMLVPFGSTVKGWWSANPTPFLALITWSILSLAIQIVITPLLLDKFPGPRPPNFWPLAVWVALAGLLVTGLFVAGRLVEALLGVAVGGIILGLALRRGSGTVAQTAHIT